MRLLAMTGQRTAALTQFDYCKTILWEELNVSPEDETINLREVIRTGKYKVDIVKTHLTHSSKQLAPMHNIPTQLTPFVGRKSELHDIRSLLRDPGCRFLTLLGSGGIGKTRLAQQAVWPLISEYKHGIFLIDLTNLNTTIDLIQHIAQTLRFTFANTGDSHQLQLENYLRNKKMLLILDSVEYLMRDDHQKDTSAQLENTITGLLESASGLKILVTSRIALNLYGEYIFHVRELPYPENTNQNLHTVQQLDSVKLFINNTRRFLPDYTLSEKNIDSVSGICHYVQGHPLSIILSAGWMSTLSAGELHALLTRNSGTDESNTKGIDLLEANWHNLPPRHRSIRAVFEYSWRLLPERLKWIMQTLSVFERGFTLDAARNVVGAKPQDLRQLVHHSLLYRTNSGRYTMHALVQQFSAEKLQKSPSAFTDVHEAHCSYFISALEKWAVDIFNAQREMTLDEMDVELDNALAAWHWAVEHNRYDDLDRSLEGLRRYFWQRDRAQEEEALCRTLVEHLNAVEKIKTLNTNSVDNAFRLIIRSLTWYSFFLVNDEAITLLETCLFVINTSALHDKRFIKAELLLRLGTLYEKNSAQSFSYLRESLELFQVLEKSRYITFALNMLGWHCWYAGQYLEAAQYFDQVLTISQKSGDNHGIMQGLDGLSAAALQQGQVIKSINLAEQSLEISRASGNQSALAIGYYMLSNKYMALGNYQKAYSLIKQSVKKYKDIGNQQHMASVVVYFIELHLGQYANLLLRLPEEISKAQKNQRYPILAFAHYVYAWGLITTHDYHQAYNEINKCIEIYKKNGIDVELPSAYAVLGYIDVLMGEVEQARYAFRQAVSLSDDTGAFISSRLTLPGIVLLLSSQNRIADAIEYYALAQRYPLIANSLFFEDLVSKRLLAQTGSLPAEVVTAARARGRERKITETMQELLIELIDNSLPLSSGN